MTIRVSNQEAINQPDKVLVYIKQAIARWRQTPIGANPWELSDEEINQKIINFRENLWEKLD